MLACHNYWHWALYLIEKVRRIVVFSCKGVQGKKNVPTFQSIYILWNTTLCLHIYFILSFSFFFLGPHLLHTEVPRLGV